MVIYRKEYRRKHPCNIFRLFCGCGVEPNPLLLRPLLGYFASPGLQSVDCLPGETEVLGEKMPQSLFVHHKSHMT
jgi:hypothetical protein